jgi:protein-L-isoaspartate(D-aspartate) O-methyltransferase
MAAGAAISAPIPLLAKASKATVAAAPLDSPMRRQRLAMIESQLKPCGVVTPAVVAAFHEVPREDFVSEARRGLAYVDAAQPVAAGRALMPPLSLGYLLERMRVAPGERALVVAAATGYSAALLAEMGARVTALDSEPELATVARARLEGVATVVEGPLAGGWPADAPYDAVLVDGAVEEFSEPLIAQLAEGGRAGAILVGGDGVARAATGFKAAGILRLEPFAEAGAPLLPDFRKPRGFRF